MALYPPLLWDERDRESKHLGRFRTQERRPRGRPDTGLLRVDLRSGTVRVLGPAPNRSFAIRRRGHFGVGVYEPPPPSEGRTELVRFGVVEPGPFPGWAKRPEW